MGNDFDPTGSKDDEDQPAHLVTLSDYYIQETEVTNAELEAYFLANKVSPPARPKRWREAVEAIGKVGRTPDRFPAVGVSHELAAKYAAWAGGRLPTEAQWEYAARSLGKNNIYVWGNERVAKLQKANLDSFGVLSGQVPTAEAGKFPGDRTAQGVLDMAGNVREWCRDVWSLYDRSPKPLDNPGGPDPPENGRADYVIRGGSFMFWADKNHTTRPRRTDDEDPMFKQLAEDGGADDLGFRVVLEWPPKP